MLTSEIVLEIFNRRKSSGKGSKISCLFWTVVNFGYDLFGFESIFGLIFVLLFEISVLIFVHFFELLFEIIAESSFNILNVSS